MPYYQDDFVELYIGDSRLLLPKFKQRFELVITDPVWPNSPEGMMNGSSNPQALFEVVAKCFPLITNCVIIQLSCTSDIRFLNAIPSDFTFFRACWLGYSRPNYKENVIIDSNVAYVFGKPDKVVENKDVWIPGFVMQDDPKFKEPWHPCPRQLVHVRWLIDVFATGSGIILDPFCGSGTTLVAAKEAGIKAIGIEIEPKFAEHIASRLRKTIPNAKNRIVND